MKSLKYLSPEKRAIKISNGAFRGLTVDLEAFPNSSFQDDLQEGKCSEVSLVFLRPDIQKDDEGYVTVPIDRETQRAHNRAAQTRADVCGRCRHKTKGLIEAYKFDRKTGEFVESTSATPYSERPFLLVA